MIDQQKEDWDTLEVSRSEFLCSLHHGQCVGRHVDAIEMGVLTTGNGGVPVIDLHGQHVGEALKLLRREVARLRGAALHKGDTTGARSGPAAAAAGTRRVQILVGTNAHSKVGMHAIGPSPVASSMRYASTTRLDVLCLHRLMSCIPPDLLAMQEGAASCPRCSIGYF